MTDGKQKIVALDIGGVCISIHPDRIIKKLGLWTGIFQSKKIMDLCNCLETGKISSEEWLTIFEDFTNSKYSRAELLAIWNTMLGDSLPGMAEAVRDAVQRGWRFIYFSNTSELHMQHFLRTNDFCHLITGAVFSYEAGSMKPDAGIYERFESIYGVPDVYFDDRQENIDAGLARGWNAVTFHSPDQVREHCR